MITKSLAQARRGSMLPTVFADMFEDQGGCPQVAKKIRETGCYPFTRAEANDFLFSKWRDIVLSMNYANMAKEVQRMIRHDKEIVDYLCAKATQQVAFFIRCIVTGDKLYNGGSLKRKKYEQILAMAKALNRKDEIRELKKIWFWKS